MNINLHGALFDLRLILFSREQALLRSVCTLQTVHTSSVHTVFIETLYWRRTYTRSLKTNGSTLERILFYLAVC
jgi:hypothetical protein